jgi:microcystin-dependent protein
MIDFPYNPSVGDTHTDSGTTWRWDGVKWVPVGGGPFLPLKGGTMQGPILAASPAAPTELSNKQYVDTKAASAPAVAIPIGGILIWPTPTLPVNYLLCNGGVYNITDAPGLFAVIGAAFGGNGTTTFAVPYLLDRTVVGAGNSWALRTAGGEINHTLAAAEMPVHAHGVADPTHAHSLADPGHTHGIGDPGHGHGLPDPGHAHTVPLPGSFGYLPGTANIGLNPFVNTASTNVGSWGAGTGMGCNGAGTGIWTGGAGVSLGVYGAGTGIGIYNAGSGGAHNNMPPFMALYFCIRYY